MDLYIIYCTSHSRHSHSRNLKPLTHLILLISCWPLDICWAQRMMKKEFGHNHTKAMMLFYGVRSWWLMSVFWFKVRFFLDKVVLPNNRLMIAFLIMFLLMFSDNSVTNGGAQPCHSDEILHCSLGQSLPTIRFTLLNGAIYFHALRKEAEH